MNQYETTLRRHIDGEAAEWLDESVSAVAADPAEIRSRFPAAGRKVGRGPLDSGDDTGDLFAWTVDDAARVALLAATGPAADDEIPGLYRHGDAAERRGVLRSLDVIPVGAVAIPIIEDALRTNDTRLVAAAMGSYSLATLDDTALAQAALKCVFMGIPVERINGLVDRATPEMARMLAGYVLERVAAGRDVPAGVWPLIDRYPPTEVLEAITAETESPIPERRSAAHAALAMRNLQE